MNTPGRNVSTSIVSVIPIDEEEPAFVVTPTTIKRTDSSRQPMLAMKVDLTGDTAWTVFFKVIRHEY